MKTTMTRDALKHAELEVRKQHADEVADTLADWTEVQKLADRARLRYSKAIEAQDELDYCATVDGRQIKIVALKAAWEIFNNAAGDIQADQWAAPMFSMAIKHHDGKAAFVELDEPAGTYRIMTGMGGDR